MATRSHSLLLVIITKELYYLYSVIIIAIVKQKSFFLFCEIYIFNLISIHQHNGFIANFRS